MSLKRCLGSAPFPKIQYYQSDSESTLPVSHAAKLAVPSALLAFLIGLSLGPSATAAVLHSQSNSAETHDPAVLFQQGQRALQKNDLDHAASLFPQVLLLDPPSAAAYANLGVVAMRQKKWDQALSDFHRAEKLDPRMSGIRLNIGLVEYKRSNYPAAIPPLASVLREEPDSVQARYLLGLCYSFVDQPADAVRTLEPLWPSMSGQFVYLYVLGVSAFQSGNQALDEKANKRLIEVGGDTPQFHLLMAKAMLNHSDDQRALDITVVQHGFGHQQMELRGVATNFNQPLVRLLVQRLVAGLKCRHPQNIQINELIGHAGPQWFQGPNRISGLIDERVAQSQKISSLHGIRFFSKYGSQRRDGCRIIRTFVFDQTNIQADARHAWIQFFRAVEVRERLVPFLLPHGHNAKIRVSGSRVGIEEQDLVEQGRRVVKVVFLQSPLPLLE